MTFSKYHANRTTVDGLSFASKAEARRYSELILLAKAGHITALVLQPKFPLHVIGKDGKAWKIGSYIADFSYIDSAGKQITEDVKGWPTPVYRWKKKHVEAEHAITITEIMA